MKYHLAILKKRYLEKIFEGTKTVESRLYKRKMPPAGCIDMGDRIFFKASSGCVSGVCTVKKVVEIELESSKDIEMIKSRFNDHICAEDEYFQSKSLSRYAVLIWLGRVKRIEPFRIDKKDWRGWVVLKRGKDFGLIGKGKRFFR